MPELPEVETIRRGLASLIKTKVVAKVDSDNPKSFPNAPSDVEQFLIGAEITDVRRRAKVLMIDLSTQYTLVIHLKMTGQMVYIKDTPQKSALPSTESSRALSASFRGRSESSEFNSEPSGGVDPSLRFGAGHPTDSLIGKLPDRSTRVTIEFTDGSRLFFNDQRKFGWMKLLPSIEVPNIDFMKRVGPEPLEADFTPEQFMERFSRRQRTTIKAALLDQSVVAGVGNIYADEALWGAKIHPSRRVQTISKEEFFDLYEQVRAVMSLSIEKGGSTDRNYVNADGSRGSYLDFANVFRREGLECRRCGEEIIKLRVAGRGTHICPRCQILPD